MHRRSRIIQLMMAVVMVLAPLSPAVAATTIGNNVSVGGTLGVTGATTLSGTATVSGLGTWSAGFISAASSSVSAGLQVAGALNASGTLQTAGATVLGSTLSVSSLSTLAGFISNASSSVGAGLQVAGALSASGTLQVAGATVLAGTLTVSADILPSTNNARALGAYGTAFSNIYTSSSLFAVSSTIANASITSTLFMNSGATQSGGRIIFKAANGATCYQMYFGDVGGVIGIATSTISCPNP